MKTAELTGAALDLWVAKAEFGDAGDFIMQVIAGDVRNSDTGRSYRDLPWKPTEKWSQGGQIIQGERIAVYFDSADDLWRAGFRLRSMIQFPDLDVVVMDHEQTGGTPLIAAMRAYVADKFGEEVSTPKQPAYQGDE